MRVPRVPWHDFVAIKQAVDRAVDFVRAEEGRLQAGLFASAHDIAAEEGSSAARSMPWRLPGSHSGRIDQPAFFTDPSRSGAYGGWLGRSFHSVGR
jgi:hypothetical protein